MSLFASFSLVFWVQCDKPPSAKGVGENWPEAPVKAPECVPDKVDLAYCAKVCFQWFGRENPGVPMMNDVVCKYTSNPALLVISGSLLTRTLVTADAGAQYGVQCWCMPGMFPAAGVDVKEAENAAGSCDVKCKGKASEVCGGG